ncbi:MAG TPA: ABC transporter ATP-binding protein [Symbiobacteriaceae bacterium]|jgi:ABC-2 type transport system ATP-binding protein
MDASIRFIGVSRSFGSVQALSGIDFEVRPGEMVGLVGPDGAGKTTLARLAAGALAPSAGKVAPESRGRVGYLTGRYSLYPELTAYENIRFFGRVYGMSPAQAVAEGQRLLEWVGLWPFKDRLSGALSGGMRQKLALACAVVHKPPILILDEPTTAVDPVARVDFWDLLRSQAEAGRAVLVTTPYMDEAEHCHRVGLLHQGRLLAFDRASALKERLPWQMVLMTPAAGMSLNRMAAMRAAGELTGQRWIQPQGTGVRVALEAGAPVAAPAGYELTPVPPSLEDAYIWLSGAAEEVHAL